MIDLSSSRLELSLSNLEKLLQRYKDGEDMVIELALYLVRMALCDFECVVVTREPSVQRPDLCCAEDEQGDLYIMVFTSEDKIHASDLLCPIKTAIRELICYIVENPELNGVFLNWKSKESVILDRRFLLVLHMAIEQQVLKGSVIEKTTTTNNEEV